MEIDPVLKYRLTRYNEFFSYTKDYLKTKVEYPLPVPIQKVTADKLKISQVAVIIAIEQKAISKETAKDIVKSYGHKSGESLYNLYCKHNTPSKRTQPDKNNTHTKLNNKIALFESVLPHLNERYKDRLLGEINILKTHLID